jgi:hypothetical protein
MTSYFGHTPYREGYFMTIQDEDAAKAKVHYDFSRARQRYILLRHEAEQIAKELEAVADLLKKRPETITFGSAEAILMKDYRGMGKLVEDLKSTRSEVQGLDQRMRSLGMSDLIPPPPANY